MLGQILWIGEKNWLVIFLHFIHCLPGWPKLHVSTGGTRRKVWLFCRELRFVAIYAIFGDLWAKKVPFGSKTVFLGQEVHYYKVYQRPKKSELSRWQLSTRKKFPEEVRKSFLRQKRNPTNKQVPKQLLIKFIFKTLYQTSTCKISTNYQHFNLY